MELSVLIVEDDENIREGLHFALQQEGYRVLLAGTVLEAARSNP